MDKFCLFYFARRNVHGMTRRDEEKCYFGNKNPKKNFSLASPVPP